MRNIKFGLYYGYYKIIMKEPLDSITLLNKGKEHLISISGELVKQDKIPFLNKNVIKTIDLNKKSHYRKILNLFQKVRIPSSRKESQNF